MATSTQTSDELFREGIRAWESAVDAGVKMQKAMDSRQPETSSEARARFTAWWEAVLESMRTNTQAVLGANSRILSTWSDLARKVNGEAAEKIAEMAKKTAEQADKMARSATERVREMAKQASGNGA
jgi:hypothetical protein